MTEYTSDCALDAYPNWRELGTTKAAKIARQAGAALGGLMLVLISADLLLTRPKEDHYVVARGDTGSEIAQRLGITFEELSQLNQGVEWRRLRPGDKLRLPKPRRVDRDPTMETYIVKRGDMGSVIALSLGIAFNDLDRLNPGTAWDRIQPGQKLVYTRKRTASPSSGSAIVATTNAPRMARTHSAGHKPEESDDSLAVIESLDLQLPPLPLVSVSDSNGGADAALLQDATRLIELGQLTRAYETLREATSDSGEIAFLRREVEKRLQDLG